MRSERKMLPIGVENFEKLRRNNMYYVDKTEIIADLLRNHGDANLFTRPRRFGKTLTMDTLKTFFEIGQDASLFEGLAISRHSDICEKHQNKYPVVFISLKSAAGMNYPDALKSIRTIVAREARRLSYLNESKILSDWEKQELNLLINCEKREFLPRDSSRFALLPG